MKTKQHPASKRHLPNFSAGAAALSGLLLGMAFPPVDWKWAIWIGLIPLLWVIERTKSQGQAFGLAYLAGLVFFLINLHPLVSAHSWTGWAAESEAAFTRRMTHQWWFMQGIWLAFAVWCAFWWGLWALVVKRALAARRGLSGLIWIVAPSAWVLFPEWARSQTTFGFAWGFLGNATADLSPVRQLASLGGVWLLSAVVVFWNLGCALACSAGPKGNWRRPLVLALSGMLIVFAVGGALLRRPLAFSEPIRVAVLQRFKPSYVTEDFAGNGFDRSYLPMIEQALKEDAQLLVLPESVALGTVTLDGTASKTKPPEWQHSRASWDWQMSSSLRGHPSSALVVGLDTVEKEQDQNTLVAWTSEKALGWYHKRYLVPFSEYQPWPWAPWAIRGKSTYIPGKGSQLIRWKAVVLGGFICQEVLFPSATRASVRDGATLLISGGNDGVFSDPAVALVHADTAQIRAVETGRFIVRAMKTGISAVIDPRGYELVRSRSSEPASLFQVVHACSQMTPYVRWGDWVVFSAGIIVLALLTL